MHKGGHIGIHEITRVEGHGNITIDIKKGRVSNLKLEIIESPRFFEAMIRGRKYTETQYIMSRICGICAVSHTVASLKAIEDALGIEVGQKARMLRELAFCGETLQSHLLHLYFLVLPDFFGEPSVLPLLKKNPGAVKTGLRLKNAANEILRVVCGRSVHPISLVPGGVAYAPGATELKKLKKTLSGSFDLLDEMLELFSKHPAPEFSREREFISLKTKKGYSLCDGTPFSSIDGDIKAKDYTKIIKEYILPHSTAKYAKTRHGAFMVGALARINNNFAGLKPRAKKAAGRLKLKTPCFNPFMNNNAQIVECFTEMEKAVELIDYIIEAGPGKEKPAAPLRGASCSGRGIGLVEAPRGTLYHSYKINKDGMVEEANCIIPTAKNLKSMEDDLRNFIPTVLDRPREEITRNVETLVRAYDPCISCSTHIMKVDFA